MYPIFRFAKEMWRARRQSPLEVDATHVSHHICWPWDLDLFMELNNGRTLTIYDLGRLPMAQRTGFIDLLKRERWSSAIAGASVRYRRRVRMFDRVEMRSRVLGHDARFFYMEQGLWRRGECCSHILLRSAVTDTDGIVTPDRVIAAWGRDVPEMTLPPWAQAWIDAEAERPWPPEIPAN